MAEEKKVDPKQPENAEPAAGAREASEIERTSLKRGRRAGLKRGRRAGLKKKR